MQDFRRGVRATLPRQNAITRRSLLQSGAVAMALAASVRSGRADDAPGVTDAEIRIGQTMPYSGPASAYGVIGRTEAAYFKMVNENGGINGRKINFISLDDAYSPPKTVEQARRLVEDEKVAFLFQTLGTSSNLAIRQYCNDNKVPQLFASTGATGLSDPERFPWTMRYNPGYRTEARIYAKHMLATKPQARIAVLYQNDDLGKDYLNGLKDVLGAERVGMIVKDASYEVSEPSVDSQVVTLQASGADIFLIAATPKFAAQAIRKSFDLGWDAARYVSYVSQSIASVMKPAGLEKAKGLISALYVIDINDPRWTDDPGVREWRAFTARYLSPTEYAEGFAAYGFGAAATIVQVLRQCGSDLSRANILRQAASIRDFHAPMLMPGIMINTAPDNYNPIRQMQLGAFNGASFELLGELLSG